MSSWCSPCCLVRAVFCELSSCGVSKRIVIIHADEKNIVRILHGTCEALGGRKRTPWLFASFRDLGPPDHVPRTSARAHTCTTVFTRASCVPRNREHEKRPAGGRAKVPMCKKTSFVKGTSFHLLIVIQGGFAAAG